MISRRELLKISAMATAAGLLPADVLKAATNGELITREIPGTGERLPIVGLGTSASFRSLAAADDLTPLKEVISVLLENGGTVCDTAPSYGEAEQAAGNIVQKLDATKRVFWATKVNTVPRGETSTTAKEARAQIEKSFEYIGKDPIDLIQVHNLKDVPTQMGVLKELKEEGRVRHIGTTYTGQSRFPELAEAMRKEPIDFIGVNYAVDDREAAEQILPLAQDLGIAVLVYVPFGRTRLWQRVRDREIPAWSSEMGIKSWGQFFIKYAAAHPAVTVVTPATSKPHHMLDNIGAAYGELPDAAMQQRMADYIDALPSA
ncbi:MAG: aldo/keto reductase [Halioglobus sp.]